MPVDVQGDGEQLRHDAVMGDQGSEAGVHLEETLKTVSSCNRIYCICQCQL